MKLHQPIASGVELQSTATTVSYFIQFYIHCQPKWTTIRKDLSVIWGTTFSKILTMSVRKYLPRILCLRLSCPSDGRFSLLFYESLRSRCLVQRWYKLQLGSKFAAQYYSMAEFVFHFTFFLLGQTLDKLTWHRQRIISRITREPKKICTLWIIPVTGESLPLCLLNNSNCLGYTNRVPQN